MTDSELHERLETALEGLVGDTEPIRELVLELVTEFRAAKAELLGNDAAIEGQMAALLSNHLDDLRKVFKKAMAKSDFKAAVECLNARAAILGLSFQDRLETKREGLDIGGGEAYMPPDSMPE
jgi:hypothetical protein